MLYLGKDCAPGKCKCGERDEMYYRCCTFIDEDKNRCGKITGPFQGEYAYHGQAHAHSWRPDDEEAMFSALDADHGHKKPNYTVPASFKPVSDNWPQ